MLGNSKEKSLVKLKITQHHKSEVNIYWDDSFAGVNVQQHGKWESATSGWMFNGTWISWILSRSFHISIESRNSNSAADLVSLFILFCCKRCSQKGFAAAIEEYFQWWKMHQIELFLQNGHSLAGKGWRCYTIMEDIILFPTTTKMMQGDTALHLPVVSCTSFIPAPLPRVTGWK